MTGVAYRGVIGPRAGEQQAHIDTLACRPAQRAAHAPGRQKVRCGQPDPLFTAVERTHQRMQDVTVLAGVGIGHPAHALALHRHLGQARQAEAFSGAPGRTAVVGLPLAVEQ
ncbi:hypothetical protein D3C79_759910 [compost metagenome]